MDAGEPGVAGDGFVDLRVVLHRAGTKRVHVDVDRMVLLADTGVVADHIDLAHFRPVEMIPELLGRGLGIRDVSGRNPDRAPTRLAQFNNQRLDCHAFLPCSDRVRPGMLVRKITDSSSWDAITCRNTRQLRLLY